MPNIEGIAKIDWKKRIKDLIIMIQCEGCICFFSTSWSMWGKTLLTAHQKSCPCTAKWLQLFDLMVSMAENICSHSHVEGKISKWGTA